MNTGIWVVDCRKFSISVVELKVNFAWQLRLVSNSEHFSRDSDCCLLQECRGDAYAACTLCSDPLLVRETVDLLSWGLDSGGMDLLEASSCWQICVLASIFDVSVEKALVLCEASQPSIGCNSSRTHSLASLKERCSLVLIARISFSRRYLEQVLNAVLWGSFQW